MKRKKKSQKRKALAMVPCTDKVMGLMLGRVLEIMQEHDLVEVNPDDVEGTADRAMAVLDANGLTNVRGDYVMGRCLLLPGSGPSGFALLLATPWPADQHDEALRSKPSPIRFDRTALGEIMLPGRWMLDKLEELANNRAAPEPLRTLALNLARRALPLPPMVLPLQVETIAIKVTDRDGTEMVVEALPAGLVISVAGEEA